MGTQRPENGGGIQGGRLPLLAHDFRRKSSVLYLLSRLARERGGAIWRSHFSAPENQTVRWSAEIISPSDFVGDKRYIKPPSLVSRPAAAKSTRQLTPQIIQRGPLRFLRPFLRQMEVYRRLWDRMLIPICETVTVEQVRPFPGGNPL